MGSEARKRAASAGVACSARAPRAAAVALQRGGGRGREGAERQEAVRVAREGEETE